MARIVASEAYRRVSRNESYSATPGPPIPAGQMHAMGRHADSTACGLTVADLHIWPALTFPRTYGQHCDECLVADVEIDVLDLTEVEPRAVDGEPAAAQL